MVSVLVHLFVHLSVRAIRDLRDFFHRLTDFVRVEYKKSTEFHHTIRAIYAGRHLLQMMKCKEETNRFVDHSDSRIRYAALDLLLYHWPRNEDVITLCERLAQSDPDCEVRSLACTGLGTFSSNSSDHRITKFLAGLVQNESEDHWVRVAAYRALCALGGMSPARRRKYIASSFPRDVDWSYVRSFL